MYKNLGPTIVFLFVMAIITGLMLIASTIRGDAATVQTYTPGGSPCGGVCTLDEAQEQFNTPLGTPVPMVVPAGSYVIHMSEGRDGKPHWIKNFNRALTDDEPAIGYYINNNQWLVRLDICLNWAVIRMPEVTLQSSPIPTAAVYSGVNRNGYPVLSGGSVFGGGFGSSSYSSSSDGGISGDNFYFVDNSYWDYDFNSILAITSLVTSTTIFKTINKFGCKCDHEVPETVPPIPLPATAWMLLLAMGGLMMFRRKT